ncbi:MAG: UDP-N-acetylmuramoyl-L-alanyl-D-glutamate--2,6-diaminopimelate ligase [Oscillospiraceae bacterium]|nr:UDP-N-acetylmuramoyl-L-alanyl-D-glutamate--2,6-diaminopimelate ligase [Oscillospiraceae bacterium]
MKLIKLLEKVDVIENNSDMEMDVTGICYDSRIIRSGELFVAIRGFETDGHKYIVDVVQKGASCIICEEAPSVSIPYILVKDSRKALATISAVWFGYPATKAKIVGVTGTNGKTSVTNLIKHIIETCSKSKVGLIGTNGNFIGNRELSTEHTTPESYEMQKLLDKMVFEGCEYVIMEVSSHALQLSRVYGIEYDVGVFTNLTPDHLDFHGTMENYALAKAILFENCKVSVINTDDQYALIMAEHARCAIMTYAINNVDADLVGKDVRLHANKVDFCAVAVGSINRVELPIPGLFSAYNALASIAATTLLGFDIDNIAPSLKSYGGVKGRAEVVPTGHEYTVLVDYAHTPDALENILTTAQGFAKGKIVTVFGCGGDRDKTKRPEMGKIATELSDVTIITTDNPRTEDPNKIIDEIVSGVENSNAVYEVIESRKAAICNALDKLESGDVLIIAGKGHETYQIFGNEKIHFDDREVVTEHLKKLRVDARKKPVEDLD